MNAFSFGSYYPGESPLHRLDPRAKLLLGCAFIVVALCARNVAALGAVAVFVAAFYLASRIPLGYAARSLAPLPVSYTHLESPSRSAVAEKDSTDCPGSPGNPMRSRFGMGAFAH